MSAQPVRYCRTPRYPTRLRVLAQPDLLRKHMPPAWRKCTEVAGAAAVLLAGSMANAGEKAKAKGAVVAPIFEHGEGRGVTGCVVAAPPVFLSEEEALQIIAEELARHGVTLSQKSIELTQIRIAPRWTRYTKVGDKLQSEVVEMKDKAKAVTLDAKDPKRGVAIEFVSRSDYRDLGGTLSGSTVQGYDLKKVAASLATRLGADAPEMHYGTFYDPMSGRHRMDWAKFNAAKTREERRKVAQEAYNQNIVKSREHLRQQVQDFAAWLKGQGAI